MVFASWYTEKKEKEENMRKYEKTRRILKDNFAIFERNNDLAFPKVFHCLYKPKS